MDIVQKPINSELLNYFILFYFFSFLVVSWDWVHFVRRPPFRLLYEPRMNERGAVGGMTIGRGNRSRKPASNRLATLLDNFSTPDGAQIATPEISLNTQNFPSVRMLIDGIRRVA
jgi:hypothetical protein